MEWSGFRTGLPDHARKLGLQTDWSFWGGLAKADWLCRGMPSLWWSFVGWPLYVLCVDPKQMLVPLPFPNHSKAHPWLLAIEQFKNPASGRIRSMKHGAIMLKIPKSPLASWFDCQTCPNPILQYQECRMGLLLPQKGQSANDTEPH